MNIYKNKKNRKKYTCERKTEGKSWKIKKSKETKAKEQKKKEYKNIKRKETINIYLKLRTEEKRRKEDILKVKKRE